MSSKILETSLNACSIVSQTLEAAFHKKQYDQSGRKLAPLPFGVQIAQSILGALSCVILFLVGREVFGKPVGLLAAGIYSVDYLAVRQAASVMPEIVFVFFLLLSTWLTMEGQKENRMDKLALGGIFAGASVLTKEVLIFYFILLSFWFLWDSLPWKRRIFRAAIFFLGFSLVTGPWVVRNRLVFGKWGFVTSNVGHMFYLGNNPLISGRMVGEEWEYSDDSGYPQQDPALPPLYTPEADRYLLRLGVQYVRSHPGRFLELSAGKILRFWFPFYRGSPALAKWLTLLSYLPVLGFGGAGIFIFGSARRWKELVPLAAPIVYLTLVSSITISSIRYRYPVMPFLTLFAAFSIHKIWSPARKENLPASRRVLESAKA